jgi:cytochrome c-type biogenesis protein
VLTHDIEAAIAAGGPVVPVLVLPAGLFVELTPGAYVAGPAVLSYLAVGAAGGRGALVRRAAAYAVGAAVPLAAVGLLLSMLGEIVLAIVAEQMVGWYLLVAVVASSAGLVLTGVVVAPLPAYLPLPRPAASARHAFLLGLPLGLAACPACTPMLLPVAAAATLSGGLLWGAAMFLLFGLGRGIPILVAAASIEPPRGCRRLVPAGLAFQRLAGWLLIATGTLYLVQALLVLSGRAALFA